PDYNGGTWLVRGLGTAVMHGTTLAMLAAIAHEFAERETREAAGDFKFNLLWFLPGYLIAVAIHMTFNQFPDRPLQAMLGAILLAPLAIIGIFQFGTAEAQRWLATERAEHERQLEALRAKRWPDGPSGQRIGQLAARLGSAQADRIRRYWELQAYVVVEAERAMIDEAEGDVTLDRPAIIAALDEAEAIKRALGRTTFAQLYRLLPFSRNDYWEVAELRQRLRD